MKETSNNFILQFLHQQHLEGKTEVYGGIIEDYMRAKTGMKGDTVSRILRFMREDGLIERVMMPRKDGKRANVAYKLNETNIARFSNCPIQETPKHESVEKYEFACPTLF